MDITLKQLRAFVAVAETEHFTRGAEKLDLSQSAVSTLVRQLEKNLGLRLFDRHTRLLRLTEAGAEVLPVVKRAITDIEGVVDSTRELNQLRRGRVSVAAGTVQAALLLPRAIREFCSQHPMIRVGVHDVAEKVVIEMVRTGTADLGVGTLPDDEPDLVGTSLMSDPFLVVMPRNHQLMAKRELVWRDLLEIPLIGPHPENPIRTRLDGALAREGIALRRLYDVLLPLTIIGMVEAGLGVAVMTAAVTRLAHSMGLATRTPVKPLIERKISLIWRKDRSLSPVALQFRDMVLKHCRGHSPHPHDRQIGTECRVVASERYATPKTRAKARIETMVEAPALSSLRVRKRAQAGPSRSPVRRNRRTRHP